MNDNEIMIRASQYKTSHVLHFLLSIFSMGIWIPVWMLVTLSNSIERGRLIRKLSK